MQAQLHSCASDPFPWPKSSMGLPSHFGIFLSTSVTSKSGVINQAFLIWNIIPRSEKFKSPPGPNAAAREISTSRCLSSTTPLQVSHLCFLLSILSQGAFLIQGWPINWAPAENSRLGGAPLILESFSKWSIQLLSFLWLLRNPFLDVFCNEQWLPSWVSK